LLALPCCSGCYFIRARTRPPAFLCAWSSPVWPEGRSSRGSRRSSERSSKEKRKEAARSAARSSFVDLGVTKTKGRTGVLILVAVFEKRAEIVCDIGVESSVVGAAGDRMQEAVERFDFDAFVTALESMGPPLAKALPRQADDENELSDEVHG
jgi:uncharacterized membrane protein